MDEQLTIFGELFYVWTFVAFFGGLACIGYLVTLIPWVRRRLDASNDRTIGPGQQLLWRQAHRTGVVPEGADVDRWRRAMGQKDYYETIQWIIGPMVAAFLAIRTLANPPTNGSEVIAHAILPIAFFLMFAWNVRWMRKKQHLRRQLFQGEPGV
jgi:hypothetical protein